MVEIYRERYGFTEADAEALVAITFKYREFFVHHMMVEELGLMAPTEGSSPVKRGIPIRRNFFIGCLASANVRTRFGFYLRDTFGFTLLLWHLCPPLMPFRSRHVCRILLLWVAASCWIYWLAHTFRDFE